MKKLLAFALVLGLATVASAALTLTENQVVNPGETVTISVGTSVPLGSGDGLANMWFGINGTDATITRTSVGGLDVATGGFLTGWLQNAVFTSTAQDGDLAKVYFSAAADTGTGGILPGGIFDMAFTAPMEPGDYVFTAMRDPVAISSVTIGGVAYPVEQLPTTTVTVVPEPMTMSLLGLGGLALIRRRRA